jgi:hypothetical protein
MSGSLVWINYTDDAGNGYAIQQDESNSEAIGNSLVTVAELTAGPIVGIPRNIEPRSVIYSNASRTITRKIVVGDNTATLATLPVTLEVTAGPGSAATGTPATSAVTLQRQAFRPERQRLVQGVDTGLNDGD